MSVQPTSPSQNTGLIVLVVGIFMVIVAFVAVTYFNGSKIDTIKNNQSKNSQVSTVERGNLTDITCALWRSVGNPSLVDPTLRTQVEGVCAGQTASPAP
jgi:hypothetical protein